ncbi:Phosphate transport system permease protein PstA [Pontiella desulfatans]|uniref:Phosphate transport system permease protein PstA n=1 Tax=Pontiella desulfatans TaxID=2750659 RepID=A0A6C2TVI8_PONDE|nr:phosphate ABC transporter permease PstA [Pontiella desulfatans]VGO11660.1 Phosphate transport system permease protein PstA [Pontiella desulfatans]
MRLETRKLLDKAFSGVGLIAIAVMGVALLLILSPIVWRGSKAFVFKGTIEHRRVMLEQFDRGDPDQFNQESAAIAAARAPAYQMLEAFEAETRELEASLEAGMDARKERAKELKTQARALKKEGKAEEAEKLEAEEDRLKDEAKALKEQIQELDETRNAPFEAVKDAMSELLGPFPGQRTPVLLRQQYGQTRWDRTLVKLHEVLYSEEWDYSNADAMGVLVEKPRADQFTGTTLEPFFPYLEEHIGEMMKPKTTLYWQFITDKSKDSHIFGGIWPEVLGTIYLTLGAMLFAVPMGVVAAIYLCEYAKEGRLVSFLRICISTLAGVPSIVFGLFGLAFFLNTIQVSDSKSVLAGSLTLSLLILPTIIRSSEEAILAVPRAYKEAALGLGAGRWHTVMTIILPAALPGILTGIVISMGRAAGETAPIIFTAAVSVGAPLKIWETLSQPTPALPWNIYNLCTEHEAVDEIRHVQYGMVFTLVAIVLLLNLFAILMRARISKKLRG